MRSIAGHRGGAAQHGLAGGRLPRMSAFADVARDSAAADLGRHPRPDGPRRARDAVAARARAEHGRPRAQPRERAARDLHRGIADVQRSAARPARSGPAAPGGSSDTCRTPSSPARTARCSSRSSRRSGTTGRRAPTRSRVRRAGPEGALLQPRRPGADSRVSEATTRTVAGGGSGVRISRGGRRSCG